MSTAATSEPLWTSVAAPVTAESAAVASVPLWFPADTEAPTASARTVETRLSWTATDPGVTSPATTPLLVKLTANGVVETPNVLWKLPVEAPKTSGTVEVANVVLFDAEENPNVNVCDDEPCFVPVTMTPLETNPNTIGVVEAPNVFLNPADTNPNTNPWVDEANRVLTPFEAKPKTNVCEEEPKCVVGPAAGADGIQRWLGVCGGGRRKTQGTGRPRFQPSTDSPRS